MTALPTPRDCIGHPLEKELGVSAREILDAVSHGFRAKVDVKGKIAELLLKARHLDPLVASGVLAHVAWNDKDGQPDFDLIFRDGRGPLFLECKNVRANRGLSSSALIRPYYRVEIQKSRNSKDGTNTRSYRTDQFDILAVCLFNQTAKWSFLFTRATDLLRVEGNAGLLQVNQAVPASPEGHWTADLSSLLASFLPVVEK